MSLRRRGYLAESAADVILQQLGGMNKLKAMIGAKNVLSDNGGKTLLFEFPNRMRSKPNFIRITLTGRDDYDIEFGRWGRKKNKKFGIMEPHYKQLKTYRGIYADQLRGLFEKETGLRLSLF